VTAPGRESRSTALSACRKEGRMSRILGALVLLAVLAVALGAYPLAAAAQAPAPKGTGAFAAVFKEDAVGQHNGNTWLLTYLATLIYPENLLESLGKSFAQDPQKDAQVIALNQRPRDFLLAFKKGTQHVFAGTPVLYAFVRGNKNFTLPVAGIVSGFEPEAAVISTPRAILVVIRGTDRDAAVKAGTLGYGYAEWIGSDFTAFGFAPALGLPGLPGQPGIAPVKVPGLAHAGFWLSLQAPTVYCEIVGAVISRVRARHRRQRPFATANSASASFSSSVRSAAPRSASGSPGTRSARRRPKTSRCGSTLARMIRGSHSPSPYRGSARSLHRT